MIFALYGALLYRWRGMAHPKKKYFPRPFNQIVFAFPYAVYVYLATPFQSHALALASICWVLTTLAVLTGHGRGNDLGQKDDGDPETLEFLIAWLKPHIPLYYYDILLLSITGAAITLPAGLLTLNPFLALSGLLKGLCYAVAKFGDTGSDGGELLTGAVLYASLGFYLWV